MSPTPPLFAKLPLASPDVVPELLELKQASMNSLKIIFICGTITVAVGTALFTACGRNVSPKIPSKIALPMGGSANVAHVNDLGNNFAVVELDAKGGTATPVFVVVRDGKVMFTLDTFGNGYELYLPYGGKPGLVVHSQDPDKASESMSVTRYVRDRDGKRVQIDYDQFGVVQRKLPSP